MIVFASVASLTITGSSCTTTGAPVLNPPTCPGWTEDAVLDLEMLLHMQETGEIDIVDSSYQLGENQRHCEALDAFLEDEE